VASFLPIIFVHEIYKKTIVRRRGHSPSDPAKFLPENRHGSMIGSGILPTGLFWFAWTARHDKHWICLIIVQAITNTWEPSHLRIRKPLHDGRIRPTIWRFCSWGKLALEIYIVSSISALCSVDVHSIRGSVGDEPSRIPYGRHGTHTVGVSIIEVPG
jgi:hypothetical protein